METLHLLHFFAKVSFSSLEAEPKLKIFPLPALLCFSYFFHYTFQSQINCVVYLFIMSILCQLWRLFENKLYLGSSLKFLFTCASLAVKSMSGTRQELSRYLWYELDAGMKQVFVLPDLLILSGH
jgi:hypothetical protein